MNAVIYARFSSHNQREESIEGQLKVCYEYAQKNNLTIVGEYIDRALTGKSDKRPSFQQMILDSKSKTFERVLVYQFDRFSRDKYDNAVYKMQLKKNGVTVISACEHIPNDPTGELLEGMLENLSAYYSAELALKVGRGLNLNASKGLCTGGNVALGYKVDNKKFVIDPLTAPIVKVIFTMYSEGKTVTEIIHYLNDNNFKTSRGNLFNKNSLHTILKNRRYIGKYTYKDTELDSEMPRIIDDELFYKVASILEKNKKAPARSRAKEEYILTTKLFCGHCKEMMIGICGTSKSGQRHYYYSCKGKKTNNCKKKSVKKNLIEDIVIDKCRSILSASNISKISKKVVSISKQANTSPYINKLKNSIKDIEAKKANLLESLKICNIATAKEVIFEELVNMENQRKVLEKELAIEERNNFTLTESEVRFFLNSLKKGSINDIKYKKMLIEILVNSIYIYDDKILLIFNSSDKPVRININLLDEIENASMRLLEISKGINDNTPNAEIVDKCFFKEQSPPPNKKTRFCVSFYLVEARGKLYLPLASYIASQLYTASAK